MRLLISALSLMVVTAAPSMAQPPPSPTSSETELDTKTKKEVIEMEKQLALAMEKRDTAVLDTILADYYSDAYEGAKRAMSKSGTIARCKAAMHNFLAIEKGQLLSRNVDLVVVEGPSKLKPLRIDDSTPEEQWVHVRRFWAKKDGKWVLTGQIRRLLAEDKPEGKEK